jgi:hypothetical protein
VSLRFACGSHSLHHYYFCEKSKKKKGGKEDIAGAFSEATIGGAHETLLFPFFG